MGSSFCGTSSRRSRHHTMPLEGGIHPISSYRLLACGPGARFFAINRLKLAEKTAIVVLTHDSNSTDFAQIADRVAYLVVPPTKAHPNARTIFRAVQTGRLDRMRATDDFNSWFDAARARSFAANLATRRTSKL